MAFFGVMRMFWNQSGDIQFNSVNIFKKQIEWYTLRGQML